VTIESVRIGVERHEESGITPASILWQAGAGTIQAPTVATSLSPTLLLGPPAEAIVEWDVTSAAFDTPAELNGLRFVVRNNATNGKKTLVDRVYLAVRYATQPVAPTITSAAVTTATRGLAYGYQATASGTAPITWSLLNPPAGMTVSAGGLVSWTPAVTGSFPVTLQASNAVGTATQSFTVVVAAPVAPTITSTAVTQASNGRLYSYQGTATGTLPITWSLVSAPAGMTVSSAGLVSWTPTASGTFPVQLQAQNVAGSTIQSYSVTVTTPVSQTLLAAGDISGCDTTGDTVTAALLAQHGGDAVATLGDNVYPTGAIDTFNACYQPTWGAHKARTFPAPGNHDYDDPGAAGYFAYFGGVAGSPGQGYYSYNLGTWHVIVLNSELNFGATSPQVAWLQADLAATTASCVLAYWHKPRWTSGMYSDFGEHAPFWDALYDANADVVLNGHDHNYQRFQPLNKAGVVDTARGIREFVVGTGGRSHYATRADARRAAANGTTYGILKLTLFANSYDWQFIPEAGGTFTDSGTGTCH
jgi:hypothetical protein